MSGPRRGRRPVFDPNALDDLDGTLAPPDPAPTPTAEGRPQIGEEPGEQPPGEQEQAGTRPERSSGASSSGTPPVPPSRQAGGTGASERSPATTRARPPATTGGSRPQATTSRQPRSVRGRIPTAVRLPADLYRDVNDVLLSGSERPSYGQLVMWTVEDHRGEVAAQVEADLPDPSDRTPRGRKLAEDRMPVGLQLLSSERDELDELAGQVAARQEVARVTRTDVAVAALRVALRVRLSSSPP